MIVDLVNVVTSDGIHLDGALRKPAAGLASTLGVDVVVFHHGVAGNFYNPSFVDRIGDSFLEQGVAVLRVNNRGHDLMYNPTRRGVGNYAQTLAARRDAGPLGAGYEIVDESRHDLRAWIDFAEAQGFRRIALWGHSLGAVKTIYYFANETDPRVQCAVASSPPRQRYSAYMESPAADQFRANFERANQLIASGDPGGLFKVTVPNPNVFSATTYLDKYGPAERYDIFKHLPNVRLPMLVTFGGEEGATPESADWLSMGGVADALAALAEKQENLTFRLIDGADHFYTGKLPELWAAARQWFAQIGAAASVR